MPNKERPYIWALLDLIALFEVNENLKLAIIEIKCQTTLSTIYTKSQFDLHFKYDSVSVESIDFTKIDNKREEMMQLLHQKIMLNMKQSLLLIGNNKCCIIKRIWLELLDK